MPSPTLQIGANPSTAALAGQRPVLACIGGGLTPYRAHFLRRVNAEIPELDLWLLNTYHPSLEPWGQTRSTNLNIEMLDKRASRSGLAPLEAIAQWTVGGRAIEFLAKHNVAAAFISGYNNIANIRALRYCHARGIPAILFADSNVHGDTLTGLARTFKNRFVPWVLSQAKAQCVCGSLGKDYYLRYGARPEQIFYSPYEPDYKQIADLDEAFIDSVAAQFRLDRSRKRILFCGRLVNAKRPDLAIDSFAAISARRPEWDLLMVGDGPMREWVKWRVPSDLRHRVIFTGFTSDQRAVSAFYRLSDVLILPSDFEPWALVVNEGIGAGLAGVVSNVVGAAPELVRDGANGYVFPRGDRNALRKALMDVTDPNNLRRMQHQSRVVIDHWRTVADPVQGLRNALRFAGVQGLADHPGPVLQPIPPAPAEFAEPVASAN